MRSFLYDFRFALRQLRKSPGFTLTAILTLAIGIGATTAVFSLVDSVLLRPLPFPRSQNLVALNIMATPFGRAGTAPVQYSVSYPDFFDWRSQSHSFESMASYHDNSFTFAPATSGQARQLTGEMVSSSLFHVLGVTPMLGRGFIPAEEKPGNRSVVVSYAFWQSGLGGARDVLGKTIHLSDESYTVVGVMPKGFQFPIQTPAPQLWTTFAKDAEGAQPETGQRGFNQLSVVARLKPGTSVAQATAEMDTIQRGLAARYPDTDKNENIVRVRPEREAMVGSVRGPLQILFAAVFFVLLIACANVAGLLLTRANARRAEIAMRSALGATRMQIVRQLLVEAIALALCGGVLGVALAYGLLQMSVHFLPANLPRLSQVSIDGSVLSFAVALCVLTGLAFGVLPAWRMSRLDPSSVLRDGGRGATSGRRQFRLHNGLVIAETAIGLVLLVGAGLLLHSFDRILHVDPGFNPNHVLTFQIAMPEKNYPDELNGAKVRFYDQLLTRLSTLPGVRSASAGSPLPLSGHNIGVTFDIAGKSAAPSDEPESDVAFAEPNFFETMEIPLIHGRTFTRLDDANAPPVVIVNQAFANKFFPGENAVGQHIRPGVSVTDKTPMSEIVGVVGNIKNHTLTNPDTPLFYLPYAQVPAVSPVITMRIAGDPGNAIAAARSVVAGMDRSLPVYQTRMLTGYLTQSTAQQRFQTLLLTTFALIALLLGEIGLYAVLSYMVAQRTTELGVRLAMGAQRGDVLRLVLRRGMMLAISGLAIGLTVALLLTKFLASLLYTVRPLDVATYLSVTALLLAVSLLSSLLPAVRAMRLDPAEILRNE